MLLSPQSVAQPQQMQQVQPPVSQLARMLMNQPAGTPNYGGGGGNGPLGGMTLQSIMDMRSKMQQPTQQPSPSQGGVSQFFNGTNTADPYSGLSSNDQNGMWSKIASMFQGMGK